MSRSTLKLERSDGGINGIDVLNFCLSLQIRQPNYSSNALKLPQMDSNSDDDLTKNAFSYIFELTIGNITRQRIEFMTDTN